MAADSSMAISRTTIRSSSISMRSPRRRRRAPKPTLRELAAALDRRPSVALLVLELVFLVDLVAWLTPMRRLVATKRPRDVRLARRIGIARARPRRDLLAGYR